MTDTSPYLNRVPRTLAEYVRVKIAALDALKRGATARRKAEIQGDIGELRAMVPADWPEDLAAREADVTGGEND